MQLPAHSCAACRVLRDAHRGAGAVRGAGEVSGKADPPDRAARAGRRDRRVRARGRQGVRAAYRSGLRGGEPRRRQHDRGGERLQGCGARRLYDLPAHAQHGLDQSRALHQAVVRAADRLRADHQRVLRPADRHHARLGAGKELCRGGGVLEEESRQDQLRLVRPGRRLAPDHRVAQAHERRQASRTSPTRARPRRCWRSSRATCT